MNCFLDVGEDAFRVVRRSFDLPCFLLIEDITAEEGVEKEATVSSLWMRELNKRPY